MAPALEKARLEQGRLFGLLWCHRAGAGQRRAAGAVEQEALATVASEGEMLDMESLRHAGFGSAVLLGGLPLRGGI